MNQESDVFSDGENPWCKTLEQRDGRIDIGALLDTERSENCIRVSNCLPYERAKTLRMTKIENSHSTSSDFVFIRRADSSTSGSNFLARRAERIDELVIWKDKVRAIAHVESSLNIDTVSDQLIDFREQSIGIEDHSITDCASYSGMEDAARDLVENERFLADVNRVAGVGTALISHDPVGPLGDNVDELSLPLVAPLRTDDDDGASLRIEHSIA